MKNNFDWDRFYYELEGADPKKFPYWIFLFHELTELIPRIISGIMIGIFMTFVLLATIGVFSRWLDNHPNIEVKAICDAYNTK